MTFWRRQSRGSVHFAFLQHHPQHSRQTAELQLRDITTVFSIRMQHHRILQPDLACAAVVYVKSADSATRNGRHKNVRHFGIPCTLQIESFPSVASAFGAMGTPPPSALKFIAAI